MQHLSSNNLFRSLTGRGRRGCRVRCSAALRAVVAALAFGAAPWGVTARTQAPDSAADIRAAEGAIKDAMHRKDRPAPVPPPAWEVNSELSLVATGGNASTRTLGVGGTVTHRAGAQTTRASVASLTSEADDVTRARSLVARARHGGRVGPRLELFGRGDYARDRFAGISNRATIDAGLAYTESLPARHERHRAHHRPDADHLLRISHAFE